MNHQIQERALELEVEYLDRTAIIAGLRNARKHPKSQLKHLQAGIQEFGFIVPILIDENNQVIAGHARLAVAEMLGMEKVPCVRVSELSKAQKRALAIADNRIAELAEWDPEALRAEFLLLCELEFPVELTGFATAEIDLFIDSPMPAVIATSDPADAVNEPDRSLPAATLPGDLWELRDHRLLCGDALSEVAYTTVLGERQASMAITDPPYNVPIQGHVSGLGSAKHRDFAMASGEMSADEFTAFLAAGMKFMAMFSIDGSIHFIFMDWRHIAELTSAATAVYSEWKALCVWNKSNGGMGSLYRSKHELVFVYKNGTAPHQNNVQLGKHGRYRTNVWDYAGANSFNPTRDTDLAAHPTVKPVAMIADAIRDCSKRGDLILDPFAGSGTLLLAAERTGRRAAAIELDPHYVDTAVRRWQQATGESATLAGTGESFDDVAARRAGERAPADRPLTSAETGHD